MNLLTIWINAHNFQPILTKAILLGTNCYGDFNKISSMLAS